jgi:hypothetical protein
MSCFVDYKYNSVNVHNRQSVALTRRGSFANMQCLATLSSKGRGDASNDGGAVGRRSLTKQNIMVSN